MAIWENMQRVLDGMFKATGHENAYFPLFIPLSLPAEGGGPRRGVCQGMRGRHAPPPGAGRGRQADSRSGVAARRAADRAADERDDHRRDVRPWVQSYRDLPILINQWANVVRWEMRTRLFLRTTEFLWQEGHTAHATAEEAQEETMKMLGVYADFAENWMAMPVIQGEKTAGERFPGAVSTYAIEAMMQDRKALQAGTSHFLGQNFSQGPGDQVPGSERHGSSIAWTTSWGVSTRLIGGADHDALRRRRPGAAAAAGAQAHRAAADLSQRRREVAGAGVCRSR